MLKARRQEEEGQGGVRLLGGIAGAKAQDESRSDDALLNADMEEIDLGVIIPRGVESEDSGEESSERPSD